MLVTLVEILARGSTQAGAETRGKMAARATLNNSLDGHEPTTRGFVLQHLRGVYVGRQRLHGWVRIATY